MVEILCAALLGALVPFVPGARRLARLIATVVHEVGHCVAVVPFGGRIRRITLRADGSGEAIVDLGRVPRMLRGPVRTLNLFAGYSSPVWLGVGLVAAATADERLAPAIALGVVGVIALVFVRNAFGAVLVMALAAIAVWTVLDAGTLIEAVLAGLGGLLVVDGMRSVLRVGRWLVVAAPVRTDFHIAAAETRIPATLWFALFLAAHVAITVLIAPMLSVPARALAAAARTLLAPFGVSA
ncbi:M50 family metallopeptidase [Curtobacterium ammoniigenes]|uniref:M50 family metallopeptidase n=1 Tax=Curtobacterium ammoniigenes TaxID=395387 RepID=UPI00082C0611|nr:M50 family metallopeptidase [Curtobacterium ammoniigenes]